MTAAVAAAQRFREALHAATVAVMQHRAPEPAGLAVLADALAADRPPQVSAGQDGIRLTPPADATAALAGLAREAVQALAGPDRDRLHACGDESCSGIFIDGTGRRRWCSDDRCGNRLRVQAHRARTKATQA